MSIDRHADKIRKLIRLAEGAGTEAERQTAMGCAQALMAKYHLDLQAVMEADRDPLELRDSDLVMQASKWTVRWKWYLADLVAEAHGCVAWGATRATLKLGKVTRSEDPAQVGALAGEGLARAKFGYVAEADQTFTLACTQVGDELHCVAQWLRLRGPSEDYLQGVCKYHYPIVELIDCKIAQVLTMVGRTQAAQTALYMYRLLVRAVDELARKIAGGRGKAAINSARWGVLTGLAARLSSENELDVEISEPSSCTALERSSLARAVEESERHLADVFGYEDTSRLYGGRSRSLSIKDGAAFRAGEAAAAELDLPDPNASRTALGGGRALPVGDDRRIR